VVWLLAAGLGVAEAVSTGPITDINQLQGSAFGNFGAVAGGTSSNSLQGTSDTFIYGNMAIGSGIPFQSSGRLIFGEASCPTFSTI
jgi:hypothetical protein